jgi:hypothetical protein
MNAFHRYWEWIDLQVLIVVEEFLDLVKNTRLIFDDKKKVFLTEIRK